MIKIKTVQIPYENATGKGFFPMQYKCVFCDKTGKLLSAMARTGLVIEKNSEMFEKLSNG